MSEEYKNFLDEGIKLIQHCAYEQAIDEITKSINLKNDWEISYFYRAVAHHSLKNYDEAMLDYTKSIELNPKMTDAYFNRAKIMLERKDVLVLDLDKIVQDLENALSLDDKFIDALFAMAAVKKKQEKYQEAIGYLDKLLEIESEAIQARALKKLIMQKYLN